MTVIEPDIQDLLKDEEYELPTDEGKLEDMEDHWEGECECFLRDYIFRNRKRLMSIFASEFNLKKSKDVVVK